jgi:hypothetical protein
VTAIYPLSSMQANIDGGNQDANFISIEAVETTDISCDAQLLVLLQYVKCDSSVEGFNSPV